MKLVCVIDDVASCRRWKGSHDAEAVHHLQAAAQEIPSAHLELAKHYDRAGQAPEAERERRAFEVTSLGLLAAK